MLLLPNKNDLLKYWTYGAAQTGSLELLQNFHQFDEKTCGYAAFGGQLDTLKWLRQNGCEWDSQTCSMSAEGGHLEILKWAREQGCEWDSEVCSIAA